MRGSLITLGVLALLGSGGWAALAVFAQGMSDSPQESMIGTYQLFGCGAVVGALLIAAGCLA